MCAWLWTQQLWSSTKHKHFFHYDEAHFFLRTNKIMQIIIYYTISADFAKLSESAATCSDCTFEVAKLF